MEYQGTEYLVYEVPIQALRNRPDNILFIGESAFEKYSVQ